MNWLTMKVLQYIAIGLLLASVGLGVKGCALAGERDVAVADKAAAESERDAAITERESWKEKTAAALAANQAYDLAFSQLQASIDEQQRLANLAAQKAAAALAAARRDEAKAEQLLAEFQRLFGKRPPQCEAALQSLDRVCPAWRY